MLLDFEIGNFRSFNERVVFSMQGTALTGHEVNKREVNDKISLLKSAVIYGANGSGKSNLILAFQRFKTMVRDSFKETQFGETLDYEPFALNEESVGQPTFMQMRFYDSENHYFYRYGFEYTEHKIIREWLFIRKTTKEAKLFIRDNGSIDVNKSEFNEGSGLESKVRENSLFISLTSMMNGEISKRILSWMNKMNVIEGSDYNVLEWFEEITHNLLSDIQYKSFIDNLMQGADSHIEGVVSKKNEADKKDDDWFDFPKYSKYIKMKVYNNEHSSYEMKQFYMDDFVSKGTSKAYYIVGLVLDALINGKLLIIDEFDASLHPLYVQQLVKLFTLKNDLFHPDTQIIFTTHDTNLLSSDVFRRDQVWFTEKTLYGETDLYALSDYNEKQLPSYEDRYIKGKYGAIPYMTAEDFIQNWDKSHITKKADNV